MVPLSGTRSWGERPSPLRSRRYYIPARAKGQCKLSERQLWSASRRGAPHSKAGGLGSKRKAGCAPGEAAAHRATPPLALWAFSKTLAQHAAADSGYLRKAARNHQSDVILLLAAAELLDGFQKLVK